MKAEGARCELADPSHVGTARRRAQRAAEPFEGDGTFTGKVAIVATELATNVVRHAGHGELFVRELIEGPRRGIELIAIDRGRGIADVERAIRDGYSTGGTAGTGLGAVRRLASEFDIFSEPDRGTVVMARLEVPSTGKPLPWRWGSMEACAPGETLNGDAWAVHADYGAVSILVADGLGHGPLAHTASQAAVAALAVRPTDGPREYLLRAHEALRQTRGAAVALAKGTLAGPLEFAGIGNIAGALVSPTGTTRGLASFNGIVGGEHQTVKALEYPWEARSRVVMHSDGLQTRWALLDRPGLAFRHPAVIAAVLFRDHQRGRDDATVVVLERIG